MDLYLFSPKLFNALGNPAAVISPATAPIIAAYPSKEEAIVYAVNISTNIQIHITIIVMMDTMPIATAISDKEDTPVLLLIALSK